MTNDTLRTGLLCISPVGERASCNKYYYYYSKGSYRKTKPSTKINSDSQETAGPENDLIKYRSKDRYNVGKIFRRCTIFRLAKPAFFRYNEVKFTLACLRNEGST